MKKDFNNFMKLRKSKGMILITHNLKMIKNADWILVKKMVKSQIKELGLT